MSSVKSMFTNKKTTVLLWLHFAIVIYALSSLFSKKAAISSVFTISFYAFYSLSLLCLVLYALFWQQILKHLPLSVAYANKSATILWQVLFGLLFFKESISYLQIVGLIIITLGILVMVTDNE